MYVSIYIFIYRNDSSAVLLNVTSKSKKKRETSLHLYLFDKIIKKYSCGMGLLLVRIFIIESTENVLYHDSYRYRVKKLPIS